MAISSTCPRAWEQAQARPSPKKSFSLNAIPLSYCAADASKISRTRSVSFCCDIEFFLPVISCLPYGDYDKLQVVDRAQSIIRARDAGMGSQQQRPSKRQVCRT